VTCLYSCDKNIFRPNDFTLSSEKTDAALVKHPAKVKINGQPSFSSANVLPFIFADTFRASDISPVPSLNQQPNKRGRTAKKITSSTSRKFVAPTQERKIKQATKFKTNRLASKALLVPSRRRRRRDCRHPTPSDTSSHSG
jgi:hypothetical protein